MRRRILIEMDVEETEIFNDILSMVAERVDGNVECNIRQEIIPERISQEIQVPTFESNRKKKSLSEDAFSRLKKGVMQHG